MDKPQFRDKFDRDPTMTLDEKSKLLARREQQDEALRGERLSVTAEQLLYAAQALVRTNQKMSPEKRAEVFLTFAEKIARELEQNNIE